MLLNDWKITTVSYILCLSVIVLFIICEIIIKKKSAQKKHSGDTPKNIRHSFFISRIIGKLDYFLIAVYFILVFYSIHPEKVNNTSIPSQLIIAVLLGSIVARILTKRTLLALKSYYASDINITILRNFKKDLGLRVEILPTLGSYGRLRMINDISYQTTNVFGDEEEATNAFSEYFKFNYSNDDTWKDKVTNFIKNSDIIVFFLITDPSESIFWEMGKVLELGRKEDTLIITNLTTKSALTKAPNQFMVDNFNNIIEYSFNSSFKRDFFNFMTNKYKSQ